ncbi:manganese catalase family protein [Evansella cellulosilytica]|uniref:Catalase n=1 Tax=Evansella cellulosilytica (strain ATCC 21833 / DSM 2522 / FERM P-1141 / JCM 9156 / N-4) TaxID=649639 RepID=E6TUY4_EVAC2|nr:manganese catalase family protein [Evansella cellulosilytica]ADU28567.1 Catalase [Evansella cellulosilytica DSM 2522]
MFYHIKELQYDAKPTRPDPVFAKQLQEVLGGHFGEISVALQYLFQGWNARGDEKYRDLLMDVGTEELAHVEMLATMIARLLDGASLGDQEDAAKNPVVGAIMGGMNPQHVIVSGLGAMPADSVGNPWTASYIKASGNLLADFRLNLTYESQGRLQVTRLYNSTNDPGVKDMLSFLIARDTMHQNMWEAAISELEAQENIVVPSTFPKHLEKNEVAYDFYNLSEGEQSSRGRWAKGKSMDGLDKFKYYSKAPAYGEKPFLKPAPKHIHNTLPTIRSEQDEGENE